MYCVYRNVNFLPFNSIVSLKFLNIETSIAKKSNIFILNKKTLIIFILRLTVTQTTGDSAVELDL